MFSKLNIKNCFLAKNGCILGALAVGFLIDMFVTAGEGMYGIILLVHSDKTVMFDTFQDSFCVKRLPRCCTLPCRTLSN